MYNILFTDDETISRQSLDYIVKNDFPNMFTCFEAESGAEAVRLCYANKIDIAFFDIHMEGINGLNAIREIRQSNKNVVIIILSAYDKFNYAQEALELEVFRYLTKPANRATIAKTIEEAIEKIESENKKVLNTLGIKEKLNALAPIVKNDFIYSLIYQFEEKKDFNAYLEYFGIMPHSYFFATIELSFKESDKKSEVAQNIVKLLTKNAECITGPLMVNRIVVFFPLSESLNTEQIKTMMQNLHKNLRTNSTTNIKMGISSIASDFSDSVKIYNQSTVALSSIKEQNAFLFFEDIETVNTFDKKIEEQFEHILARIKTGDEQALTSIFPHFLELVKKHCKNGVSEKSVLFSSIVLAKQSIIAEKKNANIFETSALLENFLQFQNDKQIEEYALESFLECASLVTSSKKSSLPPSIEKSLKYIEEHLHENITLESVASFLNVHPVYLSKLFSSNLSENFKDYVSSKRIEKAKTLLQNTSMPIKEITYTVGYNDQNYFSRLFKSNTGYTPSEYRQLRIKN